MRRKIVKIDESKCNGCGICIEACHEGALKLVDGKAKLIAADSYCDGLGACLPECPTGAITIEEHEAAIEKQAEGDSQPGEQAGQACGCQGNHAKAVDGGNSDDSAPERSCPYSELRNWPCQIRLVPVNAPFFDDADLLIAADCTAFAYSIFHREFMRGNITLIGCPLLDDVDYSEKLAAIFKAHRIKSVTVARMEVPCCDGIASATRQALMSTWTLIPYEVVTITTSGFILKEVDELK